MREFQTTHDDSEASCRVMLSYPLLMAPSLPHGSFLPRSETPTRACAWTTSSARRHCCLLKTPLVTQQLPRNRQRNNLRRQRFTMCSMMTLPLSASATTALLALYSAFKKRNWQWRPSSCRPYSATKHEKCTTLTLQSRIRAVHAHAMPALPPECLLPSQPCEPECHTVRIKLVCFALP